MISDSYLQKRREEKAWRGIYPYIYIYIYLQIWGGKEKSGMGGGCLLCYLFLPFFSLFFLFLLLASGCLLYFLILFFFFGGWFLWIILPLTVAVCLRFAIMVWPF